MVITKSKSTNGCSCSSSGYSSQSLSEYELNKKQIYINKSNYILREEKNNNNNNTSSSTSTSNSYTNRNNALSCNSTSCIRTSTPTNLTLSDTNEHSKSLLTKKNNLFQANYAGGLNSNCLFQYDDNNYSSNNRPPNSLLMNDNQQFSLNKFNSNLVSSISTITSSSLIESSSNLNSNFLYPNSQQSQSHNVLNLKNYTSEFFDTKDLVQPSSRTNNATTKTSASRKPTKNLTCSSTPNPTNQARSTKRNEATQSSKKSTFTFSSLCSLLLSLLSCFNIFKCFKANKSQPSANPINKNSLNNTSNLNSKLNSNGSSSLSTSSISISSSLTSSNPISIEFNNNINMPKILNKHAASIDSSKSQKQPNYLINSSNYPIPIVFKSKQQPNENYMSSTPIKQEISTISKSFMPVLAQSLIIPVALSNTSSSIEYNTIATNSNTMVTNLNNIAHVIEYVDEEEEEEEQYDNIPRNKSESNEFKSLNVIKSSVLSLSSSSSDSPSYFSTQSSKNAQNKLTSRLKSSSPLTTSSPLSNPNDDEQYVKINPLHLKLKQKTLDLDDESNDYISSFRSIQQPRILDKMLTKNANYISSNKLANLSQTRSKNKTNSTESFSSPSTTGESASNDETNYDNNDFELIANGDANMFSSESTSNSRTSSSLIASACNKMCQSSYMINTPTSLASSLTASSSASCSSAVISDTQCYVSAKNLRSSSSGVNKCSFKPSSGYSNVNSHSQLAYSNSFACYNSNPANQKTIHDVNSKSNDNYYLSLINLSTSGNHKQTSLNQNSTVKNQAMFQKVHIKYPQKQFYGNEIGRVQRCNSNIYSQDNQYKNPRGKRLANAPIYEDYLCDKEVESYFDNPVYYDCFKKSNEANKSVVTMMVPVKLEPCLVKSKTSDLYLKAGGLMKNKVLVVNSTFTSASCSSKPSNNNNNKINKNLIGSGYVRQNHGESYC